MPTKFLDELVLITALYAPEARYLEEPRARFKGHALTVVKPQNTDEVAAIIKLCNQHKVGVVPYGGGTGLVGGQVMPDVPKPVVISLERMNKIREIDPVDNTMTVEAGAILVNIQNAADRVDRLFPLSLASEGSCQIGGNLATNAGGVNVLRYGSARDLCLGIEAVLPDGSIFAGLKRLRKDNTGYDLRNLLVGSEGTLGVITAATLKVFPKPVEVETAFVAVPSPQAALGLLNLMAAALGNTITAFELIHRRGLDFLTETGLAFVEPLEPTSEWMVLVECGAGAGLRERVENALAQAFDDGLASNAVLAQNEAQRQAFWNIRESIPEANRRVGTISSHDISVPVSHVPAFIARGVEVIAAINPQLRINCFGHLGDGNLHYNVYPPEGVPRDEFNLIADEVRNSIFDLVNSYGGSFSAEHGVGRMKKADLAKYGDPGKLAAMRAIKIALDPNGILNPGAVI